MSKRKEKKMALLKHNSSQKAKKISLDMQESLYYRKERNFMKEEIFYRYQPQMHNHLSKNL